MKRLVALDEEMRTQGFERIDYVSNVDISWKMQQIVDSAPYRELRLVNSIGICLGKDEKLRDDSPVIDLYIIYGKGCRAQRRTSQSGL